MAIERQLPEQRNPLLEEERVPAYEILVERRCLGQTELKVRPGQVGTSNATMPDNLGMLDYAHLRVPLPKDLSSSGIFARGANKKYPEAYFLMRRSNDGFISATGMFKAAFPYAQVEDEAAEKEFMKTLAGTSSEEVAGNVWIHPDQALALADEYGLRTWIEALLDNEAITHGTNDPQKIITSPPPYYAKESVETNGAAATTSTSTRSPKSTKKSSTARRSTRVRSESPVKKSTSTTTTTTTSGTPARKIATPKSRRGRTTRSSVEPTGAETNGDNSTTTTTTRTTTTTSSTSATKQMSENLRSVIDSLAEEGEEAAAATSSRVSTFSKRLSDPRAMLAEARRMVADATGNLVGSASSATDAASSTANTALTKAEKAATKAEKNIKSETRATSKNLEKGFEAVEKSAEKGRAKGKRKAEEMLEGGEDLLDEAAATLGLEGPRLNKRVRTEVDTRRERLRRRTAVGIGATLAVGGLVPVISSLIPMALSAFGS